MKKCYHCGINVGGDIEECPICQSFLEGEGEENIWPVAEKLKKQSVIYKLQLFLLLSASIIVVFIDHIFKVGQIRHWSLVFVLAVIFIEGFIKRITVKRLNPAGWISNIVLISLIIMLVWSYMCGALGNIIMLPVPVILTASLLPNLILCSLDRTENALVYMLINIFLCAIIPVGMYANHLSINIPWAVSFLGAVISLLYLLIFNGRKALIEIQKRLYM